MAKGQGKRQRRQAATPNYYPPPRYEQRPTFAGYGRSDGFEQADSMKRRLLSEADLLTAMGDSRGERLRAVVLELPYSSFTRM